MKIGEKTGACRFWGYEPVSVGDARTGTKTREERREALDICQREKAVIKAAGFKVQVYGVRSKGLAVALAKKIEDATGVTMSVFNHDYL